jgi:hypothetical protein
MPRARGHDLPKKVSVPCTAGVTNRIYRGAVPSAGRLDEKHGRRCPGRRIADGLLACSPQIGPALERELEGDTHGDGPEAVVLKVATLAGALVDPRMVVARVGT